MQKDLTCKTEGVDIGTWKDKDGRLGHPETQKGTNHLVTITKINQEDS